VRTEQGSLQAHAAVAKHAAQNHLWLPPQWCALIGARHAQGLAELEAIEQRLAAVHAGFAALPVDAALQATQPPPVQIAA
jgi:hypothetical protein